MAVRRKYDIVVIVALVLAAFAYAAFRTEFRLQENMPVEFFDAAKLPPPKRAAEEKIARAYWSAAVKQVQWKYSYATRLPDDPPAEFTVSEKEVGPVATNEVVRRQYWQKLRATWNTPNLWNTEYEWSSTSFRQALRSAADWWGDVVRQLTAR